MIAIQLIVIQKRTGQFSEITSSILNLREVLMIDVVIFQELEEFKKEYRHKKTEEFEKQLLEADKRWIVAMYFC